MKNGLLRAPLFLLSMDMNSHEIDYELIGDDMQIVEIELDPGETVIAEAGAMNYMEDGIAFEAKMGDGSQPNQGLFGKLLDVGKRALTGESIFMTHFTNQGVGKKRVIFAAPFPGKIICVYLNDLQGNLLCQKIHFLCCNGNEVIHRISTEIRSWFLEEKDSYCKNFPVMGRLSSMPGNGGQERIEWRNAQG